MSYNVLNYPGSTSSVRNPYFQTTIASVLPDILVVQEMLSQNGVNEFLNSVLDVVSSGYAAGTFINGPDTDNAIFFKTASFNFLANNVISTALRDINEFVLSETSTGDTIRIYSLHLKASTGSTNQQKRLAEVIALRNVTDALPPSSNYIIVGDFNIYSANEPAYQELLNQSSQGYVIDIINITGTWNNPAYAPYHTQSPRTRQFGGGANGGLDDRFDMILMSQAVADTGGIHYIPGSFINYGNDGNHYNDSINNPPNTAVGQIIADAIHYGSDHLPVFANFRFNNQSSTVADPSFFTATPLSDSEIVLGLVPNVNNDNVVIAWNLTGIFTAPSGAPPAPGQPFAGGLLLSNGTSSPITHSGLNSLTTYYYKAFSYDNANYSTGLESNATTLEPPAITDFSVDFLVSDNCSNSISLIFGTAPGATECYDEGLDQWSPPPPPLGVFDGRFIACNDGLFIDYKATNPDSTRIWNVMYQPTTGCEPVSFSWNPAQLPVDGNFNLVDPFTGNMVNVDMRTNSSYTDLLGLGQLQIIYNFGALTFSLSVSVLDGWNMVSIPGLHPTDQDVLTWWSGKDPAAAVFGFNGTYSVVTAVATGDGYWMKHLGANLYDTGDEWPAINIVTHDPIPANAGWNLIGGYENLATTSLITTNPPGLVTGPVFGFSGGYSAATILEPGFAYWIKLTAAGDIIIPSSLLSKSGVEPVEYFKEEWGRIIITDKAGRNFVLYAVTDDVSLDNYEMPPAPPEGSFDIRFSSNRIAEDINTAMKTIQMSSGVEYPIVVKVENMDIRIQDESGRMLNEIIESGQQITINSQLSKLVVTGELVPDVYALEQNYPNPFNPSTVIEFSLPEDVSNVRLTIYNALGERVAELVNTTLQAGKYSYKWDAANAATGMYIYELRTEKFVSVKKMLMIK